MSLDQKIDTLKARHAAALAGACFMSNNFAFGGINTALVIGCEA